MNNNQLSDVVNDEKLRILQGYNLAVHHAKSALFLSAGVTLIPEIISYARYDQMPGTLDLLLFVLMFCTFLGLSLWTAKKPYTALQIGAGVYFGYIVILTLPYIYSNGVEGFFKGLYAGCLFKIIVLTIIGKAAPKAKLMQQTKEEVEA